MYKIALRHMVRRNVRALQTGDAAPLLGGYADDAVLVFPGQSSWGGEYRGKASIAGFLHRFIDAGLVGEVHDIVISGPPWRTTLCVVFTDHATNEAGQLIYQNRGVLLARMVWGKIVYQEDFEDTQKVEAFDAYLDGKQPGRWRERRSSDNSEPPLRGGQMAEKLQVGMYSFDCRDAAALAEFWSGVLHRPVDPNATRDYATIGFDDVGPTWMFVRSNEPGEGRNRLMLDLGGEEDWRQQAERVEALGATRIAEHEVTGVARWVEFRDPEQNTFRIFAPRPQ